MCSKGCIYTYCDLACGSISYYGPLMLRRRSSPLVQAVSLEIHVRFVLQVRVHADMYVYTIYSGDISSLL